MATPDVATNLAIRELLAKAAYALDVRDMDTLEACFAADAVLELSIAGGDDIRFEGRNAIMGLMRQSAQEQTDQRRHLSTNVFFQDDAAADEFAAVSNLTLVAVEHGDIALITSGYYKDRLRLEDGAYRIARRRIELDRPY